MTHPPFLWRTGLALTALLPPLLHSATNSAGVESLARKAGLSDHKSASLVFQERLAQFPDQSPESQLYLSLKESGDPIPDWLSHLVNHSDPVDPSRQGGETYETATAIEFTAGGTYSDEGTTTGYTGDYDYTVQPLTCMTGTWLASSFNSTDVVYTFTLPEAYEVSAEICLSSFDTSLGIVDANGALVAYNDDNSGVCTTHGLGSAIVGCCLQPGVYYIVVDGYGTANGTYTLNVAFGAEPCVVLDPCEEYAQHSLELTAPGSVTGSNAGEPSVYGGTGGDLGIEVTIPSDGLWDFDTCQPGTSAALDLYLFDRSPCDGGVLIASNLGGTCVSFAGAGRLTEQNLVAGTYHLQVGNAGTVEGAFELIVQPPPARPTSGGPDQLGYTWISSLDPEGPDFVWEDISTTGTPVTTLSDDGFTGPYPIGFNFPLYDAAYSELFIACNGFITFGTGNGSLSNQSLPTASTPNNLIAPFWDDLDPGDGVGAIHYLSQPEQGRFIVQYTGVPDYPGPNSPPNTFQAILHEDGHILIQYLDMQGDRASCTVGTENSAGTVGLTVNYNDVGALITNEVAVAISPLPGDFIPPVIVHTPLQSVETELQGGYEILAELQDESGVASADLVYTIDGGAPLTVAMSNVTGGVWTALLPHQEAGSVVVYHLEATDAGPNQAHAVSPSWTFNVVSYTWPPQNLAATDGSLLSTVITWLPPVEPTRLSERFGAELPRTQDEFITRLVEGEGLSKAQALAAWDELFGESGRAFIQYQVYRGAEAIGQTTGLSFVDNLAAGADPDIVYNYSVKAEFTAGLSDPSNTDSGFWMMGEIEGGPDGFGYTWKNSSHAEGPSYEWVEIQGIGTNLGIVGDDQQGPFTLPWEFPFYEHLYTAGLASSNGYISFGTTATPYTNTPLPTATTPNDAVYAFWDDLTTGTAPASVWSWHDTVNDRFIIEWYRVPQLSGSTFINTFQMILYPNGRIVLQYQDMAEGDLAGSTVGLEDSAGLIGLEYHRDGAGAPLADQIAVEFTYPVGPMISHTPLSDVETEIPGPHVVAAEITSELGVASAVVVYSINNGAPLSVPMTHGAGDSWTGNIPHQPAGVTVAYHIEASDTQGNSRASLTWSFVLVSSSWPPINLMATDGMLSATTITWQPPINPGLLAQWFGQQVPRNEEEAIQRLMSERGMGKLEALATWQGLFQAAERQFIQYRLYRDDEMLTETTDLSFVDDASQGSEADVTYTYTVTAVFTAGESNPSNGDTGYWGSPPTFGGPDAAGYMWINSLNAAGPAFNWTEISETGTLLAVTGDDAQTSITLSFPFPYYGATYTTASVVSNGYINFGAVSTAYTNVTIPTATVPNGCIFGLWDDLTVSTGAGVYYLDDVENNRAIVQWNNVTPLGSGTSPHTFQIILNASGIIEVNYLSVTEEQVLDCTTGIENIDGTLGLQVNYEGEGGAIADALALVFTPPSNCEPVECTGTQETEPNEGWNDNNASWDLIRCGDTYCGTILANGTDVDTDWFLYNHFGGNVTVSLHVSDFDGRVSLRQQAVGGQTIASANTFPRCFNEAFTVNNLTGGAYYIVVEHMGDPDLTTPQTYSLNLTCSGDPCSGHLPVECTGTPEVEPNEGWNGTPPNSSYGEILDSQTLCGSVWAHDGARDMDWYHFHLDAARSVTFTALVDAFDAALFITDFNPAGSVLLEVNDAPACAPETIELPNLPAGDYFIAIGHSSFEGVETPQNYSLVFGTPIQPEDPCDNYVDVGNFHDIYQMARPAPQLVHHDGTGCPTGIASPGRDEVTRLMLTRTTDLQVFLQGEGDADEVILLLGNCAQPSTSCGAAADNDGPGPLAEVLTLNNLPAGDYFLVADFAGPGETHPYGMTIVDMESDLEEGRNLVFQVEPAFPNPFNPSTSISWTQPKLAAATLSVHDMRGALVEELDLGVRGAGRHTAVWDATRFGSGVYFCTLRVGEQTHTLKAVLIK